MKLSQLLSIMLLALTMLLSSQGFAVTEVTLPHKNTHAKDPNCPACAAAMTDNKGCKQGFVENNGSCQRIYKDEAENKKGPAIPGQPVTN